eukprot:TRINITY_DN25897_c1_g7_i2.p2 TRINITY_DN25897_c1_g7~~TRINITY_DN25897_c1_g7_i2.p2  ORF type:complete len:389 (+),score=62.16 TRINITY_DN25897_c1_g7_i2:1190-2356(+)
MRPVPERSGFDSVLLEAMVFVYLVCGHMDVVHEIFCLRLQEKFVIVGQEVTCDARQTIAWNEDWVQGFLGLFFAWHRGVAGGFALFSGGLSLAKGVAIPALRKSLVFVKRAEFQQSYDALVAEISELCMTGGPDNRKLWSFYNVFAVPGQVRDTDSQAKIDAFVAAEETWKEETKQVKLQKRLVGYLNTKYEMFAGIAEDAEHACESDIASAVRGQVNQELVARLNVRCEAVVAELYELHRDEWVERRRQWSSDELRNMSAMANGVELPEPASCVSGLFCQDDQVNDAKISKLVDSTFQFTKAEEILKELTRKEELRERLADFIDTPGHFFSQLRVAAEQRCEVSGNIAENLRLKIIRKLRVHQIGQQFRKHDGLKVDWSAMNENDGE